jgi:hypothetical protein
MLCFAMAEWSMDVRSGDWLVERGSPAAMRLESGAASPELEALPARITDGVTFDSDRLSAELDDM